jgi:hypothetical protein
VTEERVPVESTPQQRSSSLDWLAWLGLTFLTGLILAPVFHGMPPRLKLLGLHAWILGGAIGYASSWAAQSRKLKLPRLVPLFAACVTLITLWGLRDLRQLTAQRMPPLPIGNVGSAQEMSNSLETQRALRDAMVPTLTDYQRLRFHRTPAFRLIRPVALWGVELLIAAGVSAWVASRAQTDAVEPKNG